MIRYVLALLVAVLLIGLTLQGLGDVASEQSDRQVQGELTKIDEAATSLMREEAHPHRDAPGARRHVTLSLPQESMTTTQAGELRLEVASTLDGTPQSATAIEYTVDGHSRGHQTVEAPIRQPDTDETGVTYTLEDLPADITADLSDHSTDQLSENLTPIITAMREQPATTPGEYILVNDGTSSVLTTTGSDQIQLDGQGSAAQRWTFQQVGEDVYEITDTAGSGDCLDVETSGTAHPVRNGCDGSDSQRWQVTHLEANAHTLVNVATGQALAASGTDLSVTNSLDTADSAHRWHLRPPEPDELIIGNLSSVSTTTVSYETVLQITEYIRSETVTEHVLEVPAEAEVDLVLWLARDETGDTVVYLEPLSSFEGNY